MTSLHLTNFVIVVVVCCLSGCHGKVGADKMKTINLLIENLHEQRTSEMNTFELLKEIVSEPSAHEQENNNNKLVYRDLLRLAIQRYLKKQQQRSKVPVKDTKHNDAAEENFHKTKKDDSARIKELGKVEIAEKKALMMDKQSSNKADGKAIDTRDSQSVDEKELDVLDEIYDKLRDDSVTVSKLSLLKNKVQDMLEKLKKDAK